ncbi:hypothetical protein [uncultured Mitsuokella sp.]|uniref:hypothetical protein n=1 Tax=uncultured Mitsuokella sp. TaxID=453120 RepID=UPI0026707833|nr:hypothetical protein [uncultured Mitsuokella sp.]
MNHIYALYKGEQNLADGTLAEISRKTGKTNTLKWMTYPSYKKRLQERSHRSHRSGVLELVDLGEENDHAEK